MTKVIGFGLIGTAITVIIYSIIGLSKIEVPLWPLIPVALLLSLQYKILSKKIINLAS